MKTAVQITLIIISTVIVLSLLGTYALFQVIPVSTNTIDTRGEAELSVMPDLISIYFNIETPGNTSKEANDKNTKISNTLINNLLEKGFDREDIETQSFNIRQHYEWEDGRRIEKGFKASHSIKIQITTQETQRISKVLDAGFDSGASFGSIHFELSQEKQNEYKAEALKLATEDARIKAEAIASGLNENLGSLVSVSDSSFGYSPWRFIEAQDMAYSEEHLKEATSNIQPGEQKISARVSTIYRIR